MAIALHAATPFRFFFLSSDLQFIEAMQRYLTVATGIEVQLVLKRT